MHTTIKCCVLYTFSQYSILYLNLSWNPLVCSFPPSAATDPVANHEVQTGLRAPFLRRGGGSWSGQRRHGGHRPQTVFCHVRQKREWTERRIHSSWSEGALLSLRELLTKTTYPRKLWDRAGPLCEGDFISIQLLLKVVLRTDFECSERKPPSLYEENVTTEYFIQFLGIT